jgi:hypothetical protein
MIEQIGDALRFILNTLLLVARPLPPKRRAVASDPAQREDAPTSVPSVKAAPSADS